MTETSETFTDRTVEVKTVKSVTNGVTFHDSWGFWLPDEVVARLEVEGEYLVETKGFNEVGGIATFGWAKWDGPEPALSGSKKKFSIPVVIEWLYRNSDQDIERRRQKALEKIARDRQESLDKNREVWQKRQDALPKAIRQRLERFHINGGEEFAREGWSYELVVSELTVLYTESDGEDSEAVNEYAKMHGTSGNQHGFAQQYAKLLKESPEKAPDAISALSPITGNHDYKS